MKRLGIGLILTAGILVGAERSQAAMILETATFGGSFLGGYYVRGPQNDQSLPFQIPGQTLGTRFHVSQSVLIDHVGGSVSTQTGASLYVAIVAINGPGGFPADTPETFTPLAVTTFVPSDPLSSDLLISLSVALSAGDYALVFGADRFGASGVGFMASNNIDLPGTSNFGSAGTWGSQGGFSRVRMVITGTFVSAVPEPGSLTLAAMGLVSLGACGWKRRRTVR